MYMHRLEATVAYLVQPAKRHHPATTFLRIWPTCIECRLQPKRRLFATLIVLSGRGDRNISGILGYLGVSIRMFVTEFDMPNDSDRVGARSLSWIC
jgi:hypothetical protein